MRNKGLVLFIAFATLLMFCASAQAYKLPDTGQTKCYDSAGSVKSCFGTGQDGAYTINPMNYSDLSDGTVMDNVTGLMWQKCSAGQNASDCSGTAKLYNWYQASGTHDDADNATDVNVCGALNSTKLGGHEDWRLPTKKELQSIVKYGIAYPGPAIDSTVFANTTATLNSFYWANATYVSNTGLAWNVYFEDGGLYYAAKNDEDYGYVRCVRGYSIIPGFTDNGNTVTDNNTGLTWQKGEPGKKIWDSALTYCEGLTLDGRMDWRLPNIKELESLTDDNRSNPAIDPIFSGDQSSEYWSATSDEYWPDWVWYVDFEDGSVESNDKDDSYNVRCVRGGTYSISAKARGTGAGKMTSSPAWINYSFPAKNTGSALFGQNSTVKVTAKANAGSKASWSGTCKTAGGTESGNNSLTAICTIRITKAATVTATFTQLYSKITARARGTGAGSVVSSPAGIIYKYPAKNTDYGTYKNASTLKISANANVGSKVSWIGTCKKAGGTEKGNNTRTALCTLKVTKAAVVAATFRKQ